MLLFEAESWPARLTQGAELRNYSVSRNKFFDFGVDQITFPPAIQKIIG